MKLTIQDACKSYEGRPVLEQLCLELPEKGTVCLFGPSGCGKTTLFNCIAGLEKLDSGAILGMEGRRVAYMFQEDRLSPWSSSFAILRSAGARTPKNGWRRSAWGRTATSARRS